MRVIKQEETISAKIIFMSSIVSLLCYFSPAMAAAAFDTSKVRAEIEQTIKEYFTAFEARDIEKIASLLSDSKDFIAYGTDASEIMTSKIAYRKQTATDFEVFKQFKSVKFDEPRNFSIAVSSDGSLASAILDFAIVSIRDESGMPQKVAARWAITFVREGGHWRIIQNLAAFPTVGASSRDSLQKKGAKTLGKSKN
jgi:ketosteroid isomerase-like protein